MCMCVCVECVRVCACVCVPWGFPRLGSLPVVSYSLLWCGVRSGVRPGQGVGCWVNANKVSGVGCDNAVDGDEAGGKDKVAVVKS